MTEGWKERLIAAIKADGRDMKAISLAAKCGENYVQQFVSGARQGIGADRLIRLLQVLGRPASMYIILGAEMNADDEALVKAVSALGPEQKAKALEFFRTLPGPGHTPSP